MHESTLGKAKKKEEKGKKKGALHWRAWTGLIKPSLGRGGGGGG